MIMYVIEEIENETDQQFVLSLYEKYKYIMFGTARKYVSDSFAVEDLVQESLLKLIPKISVLRGLQRCKIDAYIVYTVRNTAFNYLRKKANEREYITFIEFDDLIHLPRTTERFVEEIVEGAEKTALIRRALDKLPGKDQEMLIRKYYLRQSDQEISVAYGCKASSVRMILTRIRRRFFNILREEESAYEVSRTIVQ